MLDGFYQSTTNCWTGIPVHTGILPVQRTVGRVPGWGSASIRTGFYRNGVGWVQFCLAESQSRLYPHMRAKFGSDPTAGSKMLSFKFIIGYHTNLMLIPPGCLAGIIYVIMEPSELWYPALIWIHTVLIACTPSGFSSHKPPKFQQCERGLIFISLYWIMKQAHGVILKSYTAPSPRMISSELCVISVVGGWVVAVHKQLPNANQTVASFGNLDYD